MHVADKKRIQRIIYSRGMLFVLLIVIIFLTRAVLNVYEKSQVTKENLEIAETDYQELQERQEKLKATIEGFRTQKGIETEIREKFNVVKEGEQVIMIVDSPEVEKVVDEKENSGLFGWIKSIFFE